MRYNNEKKELNFEETKNKALRLLESRAHSEKELKDKLRHSGSNDTDIEKVLDFCRNYGFVNDEAYAVNKAADLKNLKRYGIRRIKSELYAKGIDAEYIETAVSGLEDDERNTLMPLVEKKLGGDFERKNVDKCIRYFIYRGYDFSDIKDCIENLKQEYGE